MFSESSRKQLIPLNKGRNGGTERPNVFSEVRKDSDTQHLAFLFPMPGGNTLFPGLLRARVPPTRMLHVPKSFPTAINTGGTFWEICWIKAFSWPWLPFPDHPVPWIHCFSSLWFLLESSRTILSLKGEEDGMPTFGISQTVERPSIMWPDLPTNLMGLLFLNFKWYVFLFSYFQSKFSDYKSIMWQLWKIWTSKIT